MAHNNQHTEKYDLTPMFHKGIEFRVYKAFRTTRWPDEGYEYMIEFDESHFDSQYETANSTRGFTRKDAIQAAKSTIEEYLNEE